MLLNALSAVKAASPSLHLFKIVKQTVRENSTRQEAVTFGQNQNIICDSMPCQECVVWIVIAGNIVIGKRLRLVKPETCIFISFFPADTSVIDNILILGEFMEYIVSFLFVLVLKSQHLFLLKF